MCGYGGGVWGYVVSTFAAPLSFCGGNADELRLFFERKFLLQCYQMLRPTKDEIKKKI